MTDKEAYKKLYGKLVACVEHYKAQTQYAINEQHRLDKQLEKVGITC